MPDVIGQPLLEEALDRREVLVRHTVEEYHELINLKDDVILIHRRPEEASYAEVTELRAGDTLKLPTAARQTVDVPAASSI
jgi:hypothetical protein